MVGQGRFVHRRELTRLRLLVEKLPVSLVSKRIGKLGTDGKPAGRTFLPARVKATPMGADIYVRSPKSQSLSRVGVSDSDCHSLAHRRARYHGILGNQGVPEGGSSLCLSRMNFVFNSLPPNSGCKMEVASIRWRASLPLP